MNYASLNAHHETVFKIRDSKAVRILECKHKRQAKYIVIFVIMIHMLYLMATHSSQMTNYSAAKFTEFYAEKILFHVEKSSCTFMVGSWY